MKTKRRPKPATVPLKYAIQPHLLNMGRRLAYENAKKGELVPGVPVIPKGSFHLVPTSALERLLGIELDVDDLERWEAERAEQTSKAKAS